MKIYSTQGGGSVYWDFRSLYWRFWDVPDWDVHGLYKRHSAMPEEWGIGGYIKTV